MKKSYLISILCLSFALGCQPEAQKEKLMQVATNQTDPTISGNQPTTLQLDISQAALYDKILGTLVGSAIGDAMGAPTEMWSREQIIREYGYVDSLDFMVREPSPEGTWDYNLPAGGTTDDTRWKVLMADFFLSETSSFYDSSKQSPLFFAEYLLAQYQNEIDGLKEVKSFEPEPFEAQMRRVSWLQEWAIVAKPFAAQDMFAYNEALSKFYGGEMVCAGLLYAPLIGAFYPNTPHQAYQKAYQFSFFDIGYARDLTALNAGMVAAAFAKNADKQSILEVLKKEDPKAYFKSRLVGRISYRIYRDALFIVEVAEKEIAAQLEVGKDSLSAEKAGQKKAFELLANKQQDYPFHAGEIHLINLTALLFNDFAFRESLAFVVNYGRDNDTVAAVTGAILGAYHGYNAIPEDLKSTVLKTNKEKLGIDLEDMAKQVTERVLKAYNQSL